MFRQSGRGGYRGVLDKIRQKTLIHADKTLMAEFRLAQWAFLHRHSHPHEQTGYLVAGRLELTIGEVKHLIAPGDSWCISGGIEHHAVAIEDCVAIKVFSPVRED